MTTPSQANVTRLKLPALRGYIESHAWAIHPDRGRALLDLIEARAMSGDTPGGLPVRADDAERARRAFEAASAARRPITKSGGAIAVLPFYGVVAQRMDMMMAYCGGVSTEAFADAFDAAVNDPNISAIVIDCDSPGGDVQGTPELAARIRSARGKGTRIIAVANGCMASAAYWICSAADEVVSTPSGDVGSIGVFCVHVDQSAMNTQLGLKYTLIKAGEHKAETNPFEPLSDDAHAFVQSQVDEMNAMFVAAVAKQRGIDAATVNANFGQGRCFTAQQALSAGMIDRIATLEDVLKGLGAKNVGASGRPVQQSAAVGVSPVLSARADDSDVGDEAGDRCPTCDAPLDDDGDCSVCGLQVAPSAGETPTQDDTSTPSQTNARITLPHAAGAVGADRSPSPDPQPLDAENTMTTEELKAAVDAERKRAAEIRALGREHVIDEASIDALVDSGCSMEAATTQILDKIKARHAASPIVQVGAMRETQKPFNTFGEQLHAIMKAERSGGRVMDPRLLPQAAASGMGESVPSDGGFAIQPDFAQEIIARAYDTGEILSRVRKVPIGQASNGLKINAIDETSRADGNRFGGIQVQWASEADQGNGKKPKLRQIEMNLKKLIGLWFLTDELAEDTTAMSAVATEGFAEEVTFVTEDAIINGNGVGKPLGVNGSKAPVTVAKEGGQAAATFTTANAAKMFGRMWNRSLKNAVWFINQDVWQQLLQLTIGASQWPVFLPPNGVADAPFGMLYGRPIVPVEYCQTLGSVGDVLFADLSQYLLIGKGGPQQAQSIHVKFLTDELTFRITYRVDGQPQWNVPLTPKNGSNTLSPFITLAAR